MGDKIGELLVVEELLDGEELGELLIVEVLLDREELGVRTGGY